MPIVWVLMEERAHEGSVRGAYSTREKAVEEAGESDAVATWTVVPVELDSPQGPREGERASQQ